MQTFKRELYLKRLMPFVGKNLIKVITGQRRTGKSDLQGKKILEVNEKYFFNDIGLRNSLVGFKAQDMGKLLENVVFNHLKVAGYKITIGEDRTKEVDFVARKNNEMLYIQVCYKLDNETTINREFGNLINIKNNYPKYVLSMDVSSKATYQGINHLHVKDFCKSIIEPSPKTA